MSLPSEHSHFTACVFGEATPAAQASFDAALLADPTLRDEAVTLSRTAHRLTTSLKQEAPLTLTINHRNRVLQHGSVAAPTSLRPAKRGAWLLPTLATAGIAACLTWVFYAIPMQNPAASDSTTETGIPSVAMQPNGSGKAGTPPAVPPPVLARESGTISLPDTPAPAIPVRLERQDAMAATPPIIKVVLGPLPPAAETVRDFTPPGQRMPSRSNPVESFGGPQVLPP